MNGLSFLSMSASSFLRLFIVTLTLGGACATSPTGRSQLLLLPDSQVDAMGINAFSQMKQERPLERNPSVNTYVKCVAQRIAEVAATDVDDWEVLVFKDDSANAFALPGGKIGVHTGMLKIAKNQHQLAAVLGHEVGHVMARHSNERVSETLAAQGGLIAADALAKSSPNRGTIMAALGLGTQFGVLLPHSRTQESEADTIGLDLMARAGFEPQESVSLWLNMESSGGGQPPEFMSTHPSHQTRINELRQEIPSVMQAFNAARARGLKPDCR